MNHAVMKLMHLIQLSLISSVLSCVSAADVVFTRPSRDDPRHKIASSLLQEVLDPSKPGQAAAASMRSDFAPSHVSGRHALRLDMPMTEVNLNSIRATGALIISSSSRWNSIQVEATTDQMIALAGLDGVASIQPVLAPIHRAQPGTFTNQAGTVLKTDTLRSQFGVSGSGRTIGIISDSINRSAIVGAGTVTGSVPNAQLTNTIPQQSGDLPPSIRIIDIGKASVGSTDEGAAMMEAAYHLVPGANYAFASCNSDQSLMADNITALTQAGSSVICDDILFLDEPMFQDGPVAQAIEAAVAGGGIYLSAAGNDADQSILTTYHDISASSDVHDGKIFPTGLDYHDWGIGGPTPGFLPITITPTNGGIATVRFVLQWNQPFHRYNLGAGAESDFDLYLFRTPVSTLAQLGAYSADIQGTTGSPSGDPIEGEGVRFDKEYTIYLAVDHALGSSSAVFRLVLFTDGCTVSIPSTTTGYPAATCYGHTVAASTLAVGAVRHSTPDTMEPFSALGGWGATGLPFYFNTVGVALSGAPQLRNKPDLVAPDGIATSLSTFNPFYGTSAATPNAAAAAAMLWSIFPSKSNQEIIALMKSTATDITKAPASTGPDAWSGYGLVQPLSAAESTPSTVVTSLTATSGTYWNGTVPIQITFSNAVTVTGTPLLALNTGRAASYISGSGSAILTFAYALLAGDDNADLDAASNTALSLNGGSLIDANHKAVKIGVPVGASAGSLATNANVVIHSDGPTVVIAIPASLILGNGVPVTITFSSPVTGFDSSDIAITNGTLSGFSGSDATYQVTITPMATGVLTVSIGDAVAIAASTHHSPNYGAAQSVSVAAPPPVIFPSGGGGGNCGLGSGLALMLGWLGCALWFGVRRAA